MRIYSYNKRLPMNLQTVRQNIDNRVPFTYSLRFGDVSELDGSVYKIISWVPSIEDHDLKELLTHYAEAVATDTLIVKGKLLDEGYYIVELGHMEMLNNIKFKSHGDYKREE